MATYFQGDIDVFPQTSFTPDYNFITAALEYRQKQYDQGFAQVKNSANSVINAQMLNEKNIEKRKMILSNAENAFKNLASVDLSLSQNVDAAESVFKPFYEDAAILTDIKETKSYMSERARGLALRDSDKEEERKRYWSYGIQDLDDWAEEFRTADPSELKGMRSRRYVGKPNTHEQILKMFNDGKLKRKIDYTNGKIMITNTNGEEMRIPLTNLYMGLVENDPEALEAFNVYGRVTRNRWIKENTEKFGSKEAATAQHDAMLLNDYVDTQKSALDEVNKSFEQVEAKYNAWQVNKNKKLTREEAVQLIKDEAAYEELKNKKLRLNKLIENAPANIGSNPSGYLGQAYLQKSAMDLSKALSMFSDREIKTNPLYKDVTLPFELETFKTNESIRLEQVKSQLKIQEESAKADLEAATGGTSDSKTSGSGNTLKSLNVPIVEENNAGSAIDEKARNGNKERANAYQQNIDQKRNTIEIVSNYKLEFAETVLGNEDMVDSKGKILSISDRRNLLNNGAELDFIFKKAVKVYKGLAEVKDARVPELSMLYQKVKSNNRVWQAMDQYMNTKTDEIIGYHEGLLKADKKKAEDWFIYRNLKNSKTGQLLNQNDAEIFVNNLKKDPNFKKKVNGMVGKSTTVDISYNVGDDLNPFATSSKTIKYTYEQAENKLIDEYRKNFENYRGDIVNTWNSKGYNFVTQNEAMAGGGGAYARKVTFTGDANVKGEEADKLLTSVLTNFETLKDDVNSMRVSVGSDKPGTLPKDNESLRKDLMGILKTDLLGATTLGKNANLKNYTITFSGIAGNNYDYNAYTIKMDSDYLKKIAGNTDEEKRLTETDAKTLSEGITIYVKKDKDNSMFAKRGTMGEIEMLVNSNPMGKLTEEVLPGYKFTVERKVGQNSRYAVTSEYPKYDPKTGKTEPFRETVDVPEGNDLTYFFYNTISNMKMLSEKVNTLMNNNDVGKIYTAEDLNNLRKELKADINL